MNLESLKKSVVDYIDQNKQDFVEIAEKIYTYKELGFQEYQSSGLLADTLSNAGFDVQKGVAGMDTAFLASAGGKQEGTKIALLAEFDALKDLGHACGHNLIGTASTAAGIAVKQVMNELDGTIMVVGSPAEEGGGGKVFLVNDGVFNDVDAAMMFHPSKYNMTRRTSLAIRSLVVEFFGKSAHSGSMPHLGINALDAVILMFNNINALRQHLRGDVRVHGIITDGGKVPNAVPDYTRAVINIRAKNEIYCKQVVEKIKNCATAGALATGCRAEIKEDEAASQPLLPNAILADLMDENMTQLGLDVIEPWPGITMGSTDMCNVSQVAPSLHPFFFLNEIGPHTKEFCEASNSDRGYEVMIKAAKALAMTVIDLLYDPSLVEKAKSAFSIQKMDQDQEAKNG